MPIIPRADESQIISAGSPVPISGTSEARMMANAFGDFGESVMKIGAQLSQVEKSTERDKRAVKAKTDYYRFENDLIDVDDTFRSSDSYFGADGDTPSKIKDKYLSLLNKRKEEHLKNIPDDRRVFFENEADKLITEKATKFYAAAVKDYTKSIEQDIEESVREHINKVGKSLDTQSIGLALHEINSAIENNKVLDKVEKSTLAEKYNSELVNGLVDAYVLQIERAKSPSIRDSLEQRALDLFAVGTTTGTKEDESSLAPRRDLGALLSRKDRENAIERITKAKYHSDMRALQMTQRMESMDSLALKKDQEKNFRDMYNLALNKVDSVEKLQVFQRDLRRKADMGMLNPAKVSILEKAAIDSVGRSRFSGSIEQTIDTGYKNQMYDKFFKTDDILALRDSIYDDIETKKISAGMAIGLQEDAEKLYTAFRKDPSLRAKVNNAASSFEKSVDSSMLLKLKRESQEKLRGIIESAKSKLFGLVVTNPQVDIEKASADLYNSDILPVVNDVFNKKISPVKDKNEIKEQFKKLGDEYTDKKKRKILTPKDELEYKRKLNDLLLQMKGGE